MFSNTGLSGATARVPVDIRRFPWVKRLAADYAFDFARVADFFAGDPAEPAAWREAIVRTQEHPRERAVLADLVQAQQRRRGAAAEAVAAAARLRDRRTVAVVTGQQAGLFGGPLFTLLKALSALQLAERTSAEHGVPTAAVFWVDAEDHDWDEVKAVGVLDADLALVEITLGAPPGGAAQGPVARVELDTAAAEAVAALRRAMPPTDFSPALIDALERAYRPGAGMVDAFARWLESLLGPRGLIVFDSSDPAAKPLAAGIFAEELQQPGRTSRLAGVAGAELVARGYHAQVAPHESQTALFHLDGTRTAVDASRAAALRDRARRQPEEFSPNVLLRPVVQDVLFPTVCYVAGPNELAYLAQLRGVYEAFGVPMPLMHQRGSVTVLDSNAMRFLTRHDVPVEALRARDEAALNALLEAQIPPAVHAAFGEATDAAAGRMEALARTVSQIDPTLEGAVRSAAGRMQDDLKKLHGKIIQGIKRKDETLRRQFRHAQAQAFPGGQPQERAVGFVYFLNKYGDPLVDRLLEELPLDQGTHWLLTV